ncbi:MAG: saccharopine dehydrogenase C-terminal domain-containing protein [Candidatus Melainabacteria bacterium]|nr:saccharopine dehydrogenase C-terminal domain-containing protein [Candidatus Melainabacteria bacterium]
MRIVVFGGGMQGRVIAKNLAARSEKPEIVIADINEITGLDKGISFRKTNVLDKKDVSEAVKGADSAVLAVPSSIAHDALQNLIEAGIPVVDVSFTPDPPLSLNDLAKSKGACVVVDCGVAPGLSHILVGNAYAQLGGLDSARILVGGMAQNPPPVFHHAVYFNPSDLLAEYVRPARARVGGKEISPAPLEAEIETYTDHEAGLLDSFLSDGLRSLLTSYPDVPEMVERTLRVHGHMDTMKNLGELGLFDDDAIHATAKKLGTKYSADKYPDYLLMVVEAKRGNKTMAWRLIDRCKNGESAMSRTTGYTTAAVAMVLATKKFTTPGVHAPEKLGEVGNLAQVVIDDLKERGVVTEVVSASSEAVRV